MTHLTLTQPLQPTVAPAVDESDRSDPKWLNSPVHFHEGSLHELRSHIPEFERRSFALAQPNNHLSRLNERLDLIVRKPLAGDQSYIPINTVSKGYNLIQHQTVLDQAIKTLEQSEIDLDKVKAELALTEYGERMFLSIFLPSEFSFDPGDKHPLRMRLECFNSVDGSSRFRALMGWFRFVCSNGMIIGVTHSDFKRRHIGNLDLDDMTSVLKQGIVAAEQEKKNFKQWRKTPIKSAQLKPWINSDLKNKLGFKAATRLYHICRTGHDVKIAGQFKKYSPTTIPVAKGRKVPGAPKHSDNLYDVGQSLAWLAQERRDVQEQLAWRENIPDLIRSITL